MAVEFKYIVNTRIDSEMNTSFQFAHIVDDELEAKECGEMDSKIVMAYLEGFGLDSE